MKAWFFLQDVDSSQGPLNYVPGSHRLTLARLRWEYRRSLVAAKLQDGYSEKGSFRADEEDLRQLGLPEPRHFTVSANTLVIADTGGLHRRGAAAPGARRLEIWAYSRLNPFNPWPGINSRMWAGALSGCCGASGSNWIGAPKPTESSQAGTRLRWGFAPRSLGQGAQPGSKNDPVLPVSKRNSLLGDHPPRARDAGAVHGVAITTNEVMPLRRDLPSSSSR